MDCYLNKKYEEKKTKNKQFLNNQFFFFDFEVNFHLFIVCLNAFNRKNNVSVREMCSMDGQLILFSEVKLIKCCCMYNNNSQ